MSNLSLKVADLVSNFNSCHLPQIQVICNISLLPTLIEWCALISSSKETPLFLGSSRMINQVCENSHSKYKSNYY